MNEIKTYLKLSFVYLHSHSSVPEVYPVQIRENILHSVYRPFAGAGKYYLYRLSNFFASFIPMLWNSCTMITRTTTARVRIKRLNL